MRHTRNNRNIQRYIYPYTTQNSYNYIMFDFKTINETEQTENRENIRQKLKFMSPKTDQYSNLPGLQLLIISESIIYSSQPFIILRRDNSLIFG
jgi:hypothetical protein